MARNIIQAKWNHSKEDEDDEQKQAKGGIPQRESVPTKKEVFVIGTCFVKPPIRTIF